MKNPFRKLAYLVTHVLVSGCCMMNLSHNTRNPTCITGRCDKPAEVEADTVKKETPKKR